MGKKCNIKDCFYCRAMFNFVGRSQGLQQVGDYRCCLTKKDNRNIIPEQCNKHED